MDDLDRLAFRVARTVRTTYPHLLEHGFTLADLEEKLAPYLETRRELAVGGPNGYEHTVLRFLSGERGYLGADIELQEACRRALQMPSPTVSIVRTWARSALVLRSGAFALVTGGSATIGGALPPVPAAHTASTGAHPSGAHANGAHANGAHPGAPRTGVPHTSAPASACGCHFCGGSLPSAREARFCPHCGLDLTMRQCPACSTELERHWRYCVTCGRQADDETSPGAPAASSPAASSHTASTHAASTPAGALAAGAEPLIAAGLFS